MTHLQITQSENPRQRVEAFVRFFSLARVLFVRFLQDCVLRGTP